MTMVVRVARALYEARPLSAQHFDAYGNTMSEPEKLPWEMLPEAHLGGQAEWLEAAEVAINTIEGLVAKSNA